MMFHFSGEILGLACSCLGSEIVFGVGCTDNRESLDFLGAHTQQSVMSPVFLWEHIPIFLCAAHELFPAGSSGDDVD